MPKFGCRSIPGSGGPRRRANPGAAIATDIPAIRTFQFDVKGFGDLSKSVNLFRGDVHHTQPLLTLPGRLGRSGLAVSVAILYQDLRH
jgi:hypothetical protein